jgi:hypothetical protein
VSGKYYFSQFGTWESKVKIMSRKAIWILLLSVALMGWQGVFAANNRTPGEQSGRSIVKGTSHTAVNRMADELQLLQRDRLVMAAQEAGLHDAALRYTDRDASSANAPKNRAADNGSGAELNVNAMLIVGLGVALISIIRRMGGI